MTIRQPPHLHEADALDPQASPLSTLYRFLGIVPGRAFAILVSPRLRNETTFVNEVLSEPVFEGYAVLSRR